MGKERKPEGAGINRRAFMRKAGATAASAAVVAAGSDALIGNSVSTARDKLPLAELDPEGLLTSNPIPRENIMDGEILSIGDGRFSIQPIDSGSVEIELAPNAYVFREGPASLSAYNPGDEVVILGERRGNTFTAVGVAPMFRTLDATLYAKEDSILSTSRGKLVLTPNTVSKPWVSGKFRAEARPLADLKPGDQIVVMGLLNQKSQVMTINVIGVLTPDPDFSLAP
jgi:hypothetical protein